jgi:hypothetical protein
VDHQLSLELEVRSCSNAAGLAGNQTSVPGDSQENHDGKLETTGYMIRIDPCMDPVAAVGLLLVSQFGEGTAPTVVVSKLLGQSLSKLPERRHNVRPKVCIVSILT